MNDTRPPLSLEEPRLSVSGVEAAPGAARTGNPKRGLLGQSLAANMGAWDVELPTGQASWSEGCFRVLGYPPSPTGEGSFAMWASRIHPDDLTPTLAAYERARTEHGAYHAEYRIVQPETGEISWLADFGRFLYDADGRAVRATGLFVDITAPRSAEDRLRESERQMRSLADNCPDILARYDRELRCVFVSAAVTPMTGHPPERFLGRTSREIGMPPHLCDLWDEAALQVFATGESLSIEFTFPSPHGPRYLKSRQVPEFGPTGEVEHVLVVITDSTDRQRADEELRQANLRKDEFLATLAHELRNPLAPILHALDLMRLEGPGSSMFAPAQAMMERQLGQMVHLIDDLLDVSRITQGKLELRRAHVELATVLESAVETSRPLIEHKRQRLAIALPPEPIVLDADLTRLSQVLLNLLNNAAKYTPEEGRIELTAELQGGEAVVTVRDTGIGIPPEVLPRIFDMFAQGERTHEHGGLGIGLTLVRRLTEMHGGTVWAESDGPGQGSVFAVRLPIAGG